VDEHSAEVVRVFLNPVIERLDVLLIEEPQNALLQLSGTLSRDDFDQGRLLRNGLGDDGA
jgi:hypothetical protein